MSRSRSPVAQSQSRSPSPDPRSQARSRSRSPAREREPEAVNHGNTLYITGLSSRVTDKELREYFNKEGKVVSCHVVLEPHTRVSRGFAFITMDTVEDAERCIKYLNQSELQGRNITVEKSRRGRPRTPTPGSYLGHRYERREMQRGGRFRRGGYGGRDDYYGNSYRRSPPPMYRDYRDTRDYPPYRDTRDYSPPHRMPETTMMAGVAGATPPTGLPLLMVAGQGGSALGRCPIPRTGCPKGAMAAVLVVVAMTGKGFVSLRQQRPCVKLDNMLRVTGLP